MQKHLIPLVTTLTAHLIAAPAGTYCILGLTHDESGLTGLSRLTGKPLGQPDIPYSFSSSPWSSPVQSAICRCVANFTTGNPNRIDAGVVKVKPSKKYL